MPNCMGANPQFSRSGACPCFVPGAACFVRCLVPRALYLVRHPAPGTQHRTRHPAPSTRHGPRSFSAQLSDEGSQQLAQPAESRVMGEVLLDVTNGARDVLDV